MQYNNNTSNVDQKLTKPLASCNHAPHAMLNHKTPLSVYQSVFNTAATLSPWHTCHCCHTCTMTHLPLLPHLHHDTLTTAATLAPCHTYHCCHTYHSLSPANNARTLQYLTLVVSDPSLSWRVTHFVYHASVICSCKYAPLLSIATDHFGKLDAKFALSNLNWKQSACDSPCCIFILHAQEFV